MKFGNIFAGKRVGPLEKQDETLINNDALMYEVRERWGSGFH